MLCCHVPQLAHRRYRRSKHDDARLNWSDGLHLRSFPRIAVEDGVASLALCWESRAKYAVSLVALGPRLRGDERKPFQPKRIPL